MPFDFPEPPLSSFLDEITEITEDLIADLPTYVKQIAPDGWEETGYKSWVDDAMRIDVHYELLGYVRDPEHDLCRLLAQALVDLTSFSAIVHRSTGQHFSIAADDIAHALRWIGTYADSMYDATTLWDNPHWLKERFHLYEIVLKAIDRRGHGWYYVNEDLYAIADELNDFRSQNADPLLGDSDPAVVKVKRQLRGFLTDYVPPGEMADIDLFDFHQLFEVFRQAPSPDPVLLYQRACGKLPQGYPYDKMFYFLVYNGEEE